MPRNKAAPAAEPTAVAAAPAAPDPATPVRRPGRKRAVHDAPLLDLAARGDVAMPRGTTAASDFGSAAATDSAAVALAPSVRDVHPPGQVGAVPAEDQTDAGQQVADLAPAAQPAPAARAQAAIADRAAPRAPAAHPDVAATGPPPAEPVPPRASTAAPPESMADRAARYRQRFLADDKPVARRPSPPLVAAPPRPRTEPEPGQGPRRALSMADIAERQRAARNAAREPEARPATPAQRAATESMQDRALRFRAAPTEEAPVRPSATPAPIPQRPPRADDGLERAAHATHHRPADSVSAAPAAALGSHAKRAVGVTLVLLTRNHAATVAARLVAWRDAVPDVDVRIAVLDLGSTDDTVAAAEEDGSTQVAVCAGGLADPLAALRVAVRAVPTDIAVLAECGHPPGPEGIALVQQARSREILPWRAIVREGVVAVPAAALRKVALPPLSLAQWAGEAGVAAPLLLSETADWRKGFVVALLGRPPRRRDRVLALLPWPLRPLASKVAGLLAGP